MSKDQSVWKDIIMEVDINGDGQIDFDEFAKMVGSFVSVQPIESDPLVTSSL